MKNEQLIVKTPEYSIKNIHNDLETKECRDIGEIWGKISEYEYKISNLGRVFSIKSNKIIKPHINNRGNSVIELSNNGIPKKFPIHKLVALAFLPNPNNFWQIRHKNKIKYDNQVENLEWISVTENRKYENPRKLKYDLTNKKFGNLLVLKLDEEKSKLKKEKFWICKCDCGKIKTIYAYSLIHAGTTNCGCLRKYKLRNAPLKQGLSYSKSYSIWRTMKQRCYNVKSKYYYNYGGRGIKVCDRWLTSFENFFADMGNPENGMTIERIDNNGNYCPENCRWANRYEQMRNTRHNVYLTFNNITLCMKEWSKKLGINYKTLQNKIKNGWKIENILKQLNKNEL